MATARSTGSHQELESWLPSPAFRGAHLSLTLDFRPLMLKDMGVFVGPPLQQSVTMATGQTDSREDDGQQRGPSRARVCCTPRESFQPGSPATQG